MKIGAAVIEQLYDYKSAERSAYWRRFWTLVVLLQVGFALHLGLAYLLTTMDYTALRWLDGLWSGTLLLFIPQWSVSVFIMTVTDHDLVLLSYAPERLALVLVASSVMAMLYAFCLEAVFRWGLCRLQRAFPRLLDLSFRRE